MQSVAKYIRYNQSFYMNNYLLEMIRKLYLPIIFIPPERTSGGILKAHRLSVRPSVRPSVCPSVRYKSCVSHYSKTDKGNLFKLHRKIKQYKKVCHARNFGSQDQGKGQRVFTYKKCVSHNSRTDKGNLIKLYRMISKMRRSVAHKIKVPTTKIKDTIPRPRSWSQSKVTGLSLTSHVSAIIQKPIKGL